MAEAPTPPPPPVIGKAGSFTVFITPPSTPTPSEGPRSRIASPAPALSSSSPGKEAPFPVKASLSPPPLVAAPPPVQVPPQQFEKPAVKSAGSVFGFLWDAVVKVQDAHLSLDEYLADWFGLNQSKYQWALNDYYESSGKEKEIGKVSKIKELADKGQAI
ncbi:pollen-specific leucine-rich repeat extensin-like protein 3 [Musa acuminata AAA Group]|uniref:pollen-specific leucine-rich repeat extensin-like protein 3 n=1 Tax=Musa acuminata AAA Group TaxID=214697 RepID=UPI0031D9517B